MTIEHDLIQRYFAPLCSGPDKAPAFGLLDDTALLTASDDDVLITTDALVAGVHFFADDPPAAIAHKALAVNVSDIVAKGGTPTHYLLTLALPAELPQDWLDEFSRGLAETQKQYDCQLVGGDTVSTSGPLMVSITLAGKIKPGSMVRRKGARPGDVIFVSGTIGDSALGLLVRNKTMDEYAIDLSPKCAAHFLERYLYPRPSLDLAPLTSRFASSSMDISDGLAGDFAKLCAASDVGGVINAAQVPLSDAATSALAQAPELLETVLTCGDDYEVLVTVPAEKADKFAHAAPQMTRIGVIGSAGDDVIVLDVNGQPLDLAHGAFDHFRAKGR